MNVIPARQNEEAQLRLLRARRGNYAIAMRFMILQIILTVAVPIAAAIATLFVPALRAPLAALALAVLLLDILLLDRQYKALLKRGAKIGEMFDCAVLALPWNDFVVGEAPEAEEINEAAHGLLRVRGDTELIDWYPPESGEMRLALGRIVCQRTNLRYDSRLRRSFNGFIVALVVLVIVGLVVAGIAQDLTAAAWVLSFAPAMPLLSWAGREYHRQGDAADALDKLLKKATAFWQRALIGGCDDDACLMESRAFQDAIYLRRSTSPLVLPFLYTFKRPKLEAEMRDAAQQFLDDYKRHQEA